MRRQKTILTKYRVLGAPVCLHALMMAAVCFSMAAEAHPADMSGLRIVLQPGKMSVTLSFAWRDLSRWIPPGKASNYGQAVHDRLQADAPELLQLQMDGQPLRYTSVNVHSESVGGTLVDFEYPLPEHPMELQVRSAHLANMPPGHQQWISVEDARGGEPRIICQDTLDASEDTGLVEIPAPPDPTASATQPATPPTARPQPLPHDRLARLLSEGLKSSRVAALATVLAIGLGCFHAMSPGHGKTVVAAYLVGSRGTMSHAVLLGLIVTLTHVAGVVALGLGVLLASRHVLPERIYPWLEFISGLLVAAVGLWQVTRRIAIASLKPDQAQALDPHGPGGHSHALPDRVTASSLLALGISGGIVPCPSALVLMLTAIALKQVAFGMILIFAFSAGMAVVLILIGILMLLARHRLDRVGFRGNWYRRLPMASSLVITLLGLMLAGRAVLNGGILN